MNEIETPWEARRLKYLFDYSLSSVDRHVDPEQTPVKVCHYPFVYKNERLTQTLDFPAGTCTQEEYERFRLFRGDILITKDSESPLDIGVPAFVVEDLDNVVCGYHLGVLRSRTTVDTGYFFRFLQSDFVKGYFYCEASGITRYGLGKDSVLNLQLPLPPLDEQRLISRYLDKKTQQIDTLIEKIEKKIELLKEQRTSLINHYITKGLDPNVEMKDSGVKWIGKIPKHWEVKKLKWLVEIETGRDPAPIYSDDGPYEVLGTGGVIGRTHSFMWDEDSLILGRKGTIDKPFLQKSPFWISDVVYYTKPTSHLTADYIWYLFTQIDFSYYKYGSTLPSMSKDEYGNMKFPVPPADEYFAIASTLESVWKRIENLVSLYKNKVDKLSEYRQSLISSVVTGKVRVTEDMV